MCTRGKVRLEGGATSAQGTVGACLEINGEQCVTATGQMQMPKWCVASYAIQVKKLGVIPTPIFIIVILRW